MKKKVLALLLVTVMVLAVFSACGKETPAETAPESEPVAEETPEAQEAEEEEAEAPAEQQFVIGFSQLGAESGWRTAETESIKSACEADPNVELIFSDAQQQQEDQVKAIRSFIQQEVDIIAMAPVVETGWDTVLGEAKEAGIPVVLVDRGIDTEDESLYTTLMSSDFVYEGEKAAEYIVNRFGEDAEVNIVELQGTVGASAATERMEGFANYIADYSGYEIIASQTGDFTRSLGKEVMEAFLKSYGDTIDVLYAHNDDMALGAIEAIKEYGLDPGDDIIIVSIDGVKGAFEAIAAGDMNCTVECTPLYGPPLIDVSKKILAGESVEKWIQAEDRVFADEDAVAELPNRVY